MAKWNDPMRRDDSNRLFSLEVQVYRLPPFLEHQVSKFRSHIFKQTAPFPSPGEIGFSLLCLGWQQGIPP